MRLVDARDAPAVVRVTELHHAASPSIANDNRRRRVCRGTEAGSSPTLSCTGDAFAGEVGDAAAKRGGFDGLGEVGLEAGGERADAVFLAGVGGERDGGDRRRRCVGGQLADARGSGRSRPRRACAMSLTSTCGRRRCEVLQRLVGAAGGGDDGAGSAQDRGRSSSRGVGLVVDDQHAHAGRGPPASRGVCTARSTRRRRGSGGGALRRGASARVRTAATGSVTVNVAPCPSPALSASTVPPCSSTMCRTIVSPMPSPPCDARAAAVGLAEAVEDVRAGTSASMPAPVSVTRIATCAVDAVEPHLDAPAVRRELHRVAEQVPDDLLQPVGVAVDLVAASPSSVDCELRCRLRLGRGPDRVDRGLDDRRRASIGRDVQPQLAGGDARDVEQVLDELRLRLGVALDHLEAVAESRRRALLDRGAAASSRGSR